MATRKELADLIFPEVTETIQDLEKKYPPRANTYCSRFAPSPTGFLHIGGVFTALVARKYIKQHDGTYILRIEDTDQKRQVDGALETVIQAMKTFGIDIDEGPLGTDHQDVGDYGPYTQSHRKHLYNVFVKHLIAEGKAYPCWMQESELESIRDQQMKSKVMPGIYGNYSLRRNKSIEELIQQYQSNSDCVIRFRSHGDTQAKIIFDDILRGKINMTDNYNDIVLRKRDGLPTYHLAHITDDYLMRVSHIVRAEERLTSVPLHLQLFDAVGLQSPQYTHLAQLLKNDEETGKKRKLSKRKDPEANVDFFFEKGYAVQGIINYLFTIVDSSFEEWQKNNPEKTYKDFDIHLEKMNKSGALFDLVKMRAINNDYLSLISTDELYQQTLDRSEKHNQELAKLMKNNEEYTKKAINIERFTEKDPKRFYTFEDVGQQLYFFYDTEWEKLQSEKPELPESITQEVINAFVPAYLDVLDLNVPVEEWFVQFKEIGKQYGFAGNNKEFKEGGYIGKVGELAMLLRVQLCCMAQTPDLYSVMQVMGKERITQRLMQLVKN